MNWIRIARGMKDDPRIFTLAAACKVRPAEAVGLIVNVLVELPDHARDGDLSGVPAGTVEAWARWHGRPGIFDAAFRKSLCENEKVRSWEKHNGPAVRALEAAKQRSKDWRERKEKRPPNAERTANATHTERVTSPEPNASRSPLQDNTRQYKTGLQTHTTTAREAGALAFDHPAAQGAYAEMRRTAPNPAAFDAMLKTVADPITGGPAYTWPEIGAALVELAPQGGVPSAVSVRAFCRRVRAGEAVQGGGDDADAVIARSFAKAEAEMRAQQQGAA